MNSKRDKEDQVFNIEKYRKAKHLLLGLNRKIRNLIPMNFKIDDFQKAGHTETGVGLIDGQSVERVIIILRGCGCDWANKADGGCIMCGHLSGSSKGEYIPSEHLKKQFDDALKKYDFREYPMLCLYNGGSFLNEREIPRDLRRYMLERIHAESHIKRLIIESRTDFITWENLEEIGTLLPDTSVEIGVGIETADDTIRELILNKGVTTKQLIRTAERFRGSKIRLLAYLLVNPPFLTEAEAVEDTVRGIEFAHKIGADAVSLEAVSIQHLTTVSFLAEAGFYKPPWIWSLFEIVKRTHHLGLEIRIGGFEFFPIPKEFTSNCPVCNGEMVNKIQEFNRTGNLKIIENLTCANRCDLLWRKEMERIDTRDLPGRVISAIESTNVEEVLNRIKSPQFN
jgi:radical SAM enzyme (TIGR01210 family)